MNWPTLGIMLFTYDRLEYAKQTARAVLDNLKYSGDIVFHIADDGSPKEYREELRYFVGCWAHLKGIGVTNSERGGYGASYNQATMQVHPMCPIILPLEDDWILTEELNIDSLVSVLLTEPEIGCIRLGYIGYIPGQEILAKFFWADNQHFLLLHPKSPSQYVFSGGPRLERVDWARNVGPWPEGLPAGETELAVAGRIAARTGVAWPVDLIKPSGGLFKHIGEHPVKNAPLRSVALT